MSNSGKIVLTAFQGKLKSAPMEMPFNISPTIQMRLDVDPDKYYTFSGDLIAGQSKPIQKMGTFRRNGLHEILPNGDSAAIYVLVDIT